MSLSPTALVQDNDDINLNGIDCLSDGINDGSLISSRYSNKGQPSTIGTPARGSYVISEEGKTRGICARLEQWNDLDDDDGGGNAFPSISSSSPSIDFLPNDTNGPRKMEDVPLSKKRYLTPTRLHLKKRFIKFRRNYLAAFSRVVYRLSGVLFNYPFRSIFIFTLISLCLSAGFFVAKMEEDVYKLYSMPNSQAVQHAKQISELYKENRANFVMFSNTEGPGQLFSNEMNMTALWAMDNFIRRRMTVPRLKFEDGLNPGHRIWKFLDPEPGIDMGFMRYADVCTLRGGLNRGDAVPLFDRVSSAVYDTETLPLTSELLNKHDTDDHCDFISSTSAWKYPRFGKTSRSGVWAPSLVRTRNWPYYGMSWSQRALNLEMTFFTPKTEILRHPRTNEPIFTEVVDAPGMMFLYYTDNCEKGMDCESFAWERTLINFINDFRREREVLLAMPGHETEEPLIWFDTFGNVAKSGWYNVKQHCSTNGAIAIDRRNNGTLICELPNGETQPTDTIVVNSRSVEITVYGGNSWTDELARSTTFDFELLSNYLLSFIIVSCYGAFSMSTRNVYRSKTIVGVAAAISGILGYAAGAGICYLFGLRHTATMNSVPFLAMGIAMDDAFVMINAYAMTYYLEAVTEGDAERTKEESLALARHRCSLALTESAIAITLTTLTNLVSFTVGIMSPYVAARNFCVISVFGLFGGYIGAFFFFWPVVCLMAKFEYLSPPPPLLMERIIKGAGLTLDRDAPRHAEHGTKGYVSPKNFKDYHLKDVIKVNAMVTFRQYRVIRFTNELAKRELITVSTNISKAVKSVFDGSKYQKARGLGDEATSISADLSPLESVVPATFDEAIFHEALPPPVDANRIATEALETNHIEGSDHRKLHMLAACAKEEYKLVEPPKGTISRGSRSLIVRLVMSLMRRAFVRWSVVVFFLLVTAFMTLMISTRFSKGLEQLSLVPPDSYLNGFYEMSEKNEIFLIEGQLVFIIQEGHHFGDDDVQLLFHDLANLVREKEYINSTLNPLGLFDEWLSTQKDRPWQKIDIMAVTPEFDGTFAKHEYESALLYWNMNKADGIQMNKYLRWKSLPGAPQVQDPAAPVLPTFTDDIPWMDPSKARLDSIMLVYFNTFHEDVAVQSKYFNALRSITDAFNIDHGHKMKVVEYNSLHEFFETDQIILRQTLLSMGAALIGIGIVTTLLMDSSHVVNANTIIVISMIILMDITVFGTMAYFGIKLNIITMIVLIMSIGFSVDFSLHTAHQYKHMEGNLLERLAMTIIYIGLPLFQGLTSTCLAATPLIGRLDEYIYATFFYMVIMVLVVGFSYGVVLLPQVLVIIDQFRGEKEAESFRDFVRLYQVELDQRPTGQYCVSEGQLTRSVNVLSDLSDDI